MIQRSEWFNEGCHYYERNKKCLRDQDKDRKVNIGFLSVISRSDRNLGQEIRDLNLKLKRFSEGNNLLFVDNVNVEESCLNNSKLYLNHKGTNVLCQHIKNSIYHYWSSTKSRKIAITNLSFSKDIDQILFELKSNNPSNLNFYYLNTNSVRNKFENFKEIINGNVDVFTIGETKLDGSFPTSRFGPEGYYSSFCLDIAKPNGGLLVYIKSSIPSRQLSDGRICNSIQAKRRKMRQEKWLMISIYDLPSKDSGLLISFILSMIITLLWGILAWN